MPHDAVFITDDPLAVYLREVSRVPALDRAEELACIEHVRAGDAMAEFASRRLIEANLGIVVSLAERYRTERIHMLELIEKGNAGLLRAVRSLPDRAVDSFAVYAAEFIQNALFDAAGSRSRKTQS